MEVLNGGVDEIDEYQKLVIRMNDTPGIVVDNATSPTATIIKIDSTRKHGILLDTVQLLADLNLSVTKAYISSDGRWFMDVFHVTDHLGRKLTDTTIISSIERSLSQPASLTGTESTIVLELFGPDRPGLLSEVFAVLADLNCSVQEAKVWAHNGRIASIIKLNGSHDPDNICQVLRHVVARADVASPVVVHADRRLHQMMIADVSGPETETTVSVQDWAERGYTVVGVQCRDRTKLLFDIVCTLTDMGFTVFHGNIDTKDNQAYQEFYIKRSDGSPLCLVADRQCLVQCLQAAIERRSSEGLGLELDTESHPTLLADITRKFRESGLLVRRAEVSTDGAMATGVFYVTDAAGLSPDMETVNGVMERIGAGCIKVKHDLRQLVQYPKTVGRLQESTGGTRLWHLASLVVRNLYNLGLVRFCSN